MSGQRYRVQVKADCVRMPDRCLVCGGNADCVEVVQFTRALILGVIGGIETIPMEVPLCSAHPKEYHVRLKRYEASLALTALSGCGLGFGPVILLGHSGSPGPVTTGVIIAGFALIFIAFGIFVTRGRCFPVQFRPHQGMLFTGYSRFTFTFPAKAAAQAFADANDAEVLALE